MRKIMSYILVLILGICLGKGIILFQIGHDIKTQYKMSEKGISTPYNDEITVKKIYTYNYVKNRTLL